jgi:hypothetical protein
MMPDPVSRLAPAQSEIDKLFGQNYARENPAVLVAVIKAASSDWAAARLATAIEHVAAALVVGDELENGGIVSARELFRVRP